MRRRQIITAAAACGAGALAPRLALAQPARYPTKAVRVLVPFAPGQGSDVLARALTDRLSAMWDQPVVVENRSGANGMLAAQEVAKAAPDGHTLLLSSNSPIVINPNLYKKLPYNVEADFRPIALLATTELALLVTPSLPVKNVAEFIAYGKAHPGKLSFGTPGAGSTSHLLMEAFKNESGLVMTHVPYKGSAPAMTDLMAGNTQAMMDALPSSVGHVRAGRIRALAVTGKSETWALPGVPTLASAGIRLPASGGWYGMFAPTGTDPALVQRLNADFLGVVLHADFAPRLKALYLDPAPTLSPAQFGQMVKTETGQWEQTTRSLGLFRTE